MTKELGGEYGKGYNFLVPAASVQAEALCLWVLPTKCEVKLKGLMASAKHGFIVVQPPLSRARTPTSEPWRKGRDESRLGYPCEFRIPKSVTGLTNHGDSVGRDGDFNEAD